MARAIHGLAYFAHPARDTGGRFVLDDAYGLDFVTPICAESRFNVLWIHAVAPVALHHFDFETKFRSHLPPQHCELTDLEHQNLIAGRQSIDQ